MLRDRTRTTPELPMRLEYSVRSADDVIDPAELGGATTPTFTRERPEEWSGQSGHIETGMLAAPAPGVAFVCGGNGCVETASPLLLESGFDALAIRTERLGPS